MALRWAVYAALRRTTRDDARRGAIYDARCRNGTTRPWHCVGRCTRWCRQIVILRRTDRATQVSPLRCRVFVRGIAAVIRATQVSPLRRGVFGRDIAAVIRATQVSPLRCGVFVHGIAAVIRATQVSPLRCGVFVHGIAAVIRATQVSPLRRGVFVRDVAAGRGCQRSTISTTGTVLTKSLFVT